MGKPLIVSMIFNNAQTIRAGLGKLRETTAPGSFRLCLLDQHYPLRYQETHAEILHQAEVFGEHIGSDNVQIVDPGENLGLHLGLNHAIRTCDAKVRLDDADVVVGYDPDEQPLKGGWLGAMCSVLATEHARPAGEKRCAWLSLTSKPAREYMLKAGYAALNIAGVEVWRPPYALINHVCGWTMGAIRTVGAFTEPHAFYGGIEVAMQPRYADHGYWHGYLAEYEDSSFHHLIDPQYAAWKRDHVHGSFAGDFKSYLDMRLA